jgi:hypothetical protein
VSVHVLSWAWKQKVGDAATKIVLLKLADCADDDGYSWWGQKKLAAECELGRATVQRKLERLQTFGLLEVVPRERDDGGTSTNGYRIKRPRSTPLPHSEAPPPQSEAGPPVTVRHPPPHGEAGTTLNRKKNPTLSKNESVPARSPFDDLWDAIEACGMKAPSAKSPRADFAKAVRELHMTGATPDLVRRRVAAYKAHPTLGATMLTVFSLRKWWDQLEADSKTPLERLEERIAAHDRRES